MSIKHASALAWLSDEVQNTLEELNKALSGLMALDDSQRHLVLADCLEKTHAIVGVFEVARCPALAHYSQMIQLVLTSCKDLPERLMQQSLTTSQAACAALAEYLQLLQEGEHYSELSLFEPYRQLCEIVGQVSHPFDLGPIAECSAILDSLLAQEEGAAKERNAILKRLSQTQLGDIGSYDIDTLMLKLLRAKGGVDEVCDAFLEVCDKRASLSSDNLQMLCGVFLRSLFQSLKNRYLNLDIFLKRHLLASMVWLKGGVVTQEFVKHTIFFIYLAWQESYASQNAKDKSSADIFKDDSWEPLKGTKYSQQSFGRQKVDTVLKATEAVIASKQSWMKFCSLGQSSPSFEQESELKTAFENLNQSLVELHPKASGVTDALNQILIDQSLLSQRELQIEVASILLILEGVIADVRGLDDTQLEERFVDLANRLTSMCEGQNIGTLKPWMLELHQRQALSHTMEDAFNQLKQKLTEIETTLVYFSAHKYDEVGVASVSDKLKQIASVSSSLNMPNFSSIALSLEKKIQSIIASPPQAQPEIQHQITSNLAALGLMLDLFSFRSDQATDLMHFDIGMALPSSETTSALDAKDASLQNTDPAELKEESIEHIFLSETQETLAIAREAQSELSKKPDDIEALVVLRRAFHTIKGSARMIGFVDFGEAAWLMEQKLNDRLAEKRSVSAPLAEVSHRLLTSMQSWTDQLQNHKNPASLKIDYSLDALAQALIESDRPTGLIDLPQNWLDLTEATSQSSQDVDEILPNNSSDEMIKVIGDLRISIPLYNAYLNEADEWSRQLALALSEWALDSRQAIPSQAMTWAHALAGSSATIGFVELSKLAKSVERLIDRVIDEDLHSLGLDQTLAEAADELQRVLHQFAAGFIKLPSALIQNKVDAHLQPQASIDAGTISSELTPAPDAEMMSIFRDEAAQLIPELGAALRLWTQSEAQSSEQRQHESQALRLLHTLKGSARLVGLQDLAQITHDLETSIEALSLSFDETGALAALKQFDQLHGLFEATNPAAVEPFIAFTQTVDAVQAQPVASQPMLVPAGETIRVRAAIVDRLVNQMGEVMIARSRMEAETSRSLHTLSDLAEQVQRLREQLRELELQTESQMQSRQAQVNDQAQAFDPLEFDRFTRTQELTRFMAESLSDVSTLQRSLQRSVNATEDELAAQSRLTKDLQRHLLRTRMVEFDSVAERLHRLVRLTAQELNKSADLSITNGAQELDRSVLERMLPAFEHLLRNAVVHGIEQSSVRQAKGKSGAGHISIKLEQHGNDVMVTLHDDGRGIDGEAVRNKARQLAVVPDNVDPTQLIFMSGLTTAPEVSELAGRGIGMDVVRAQIQALGGRIEVESQPDRGATFKLVLPLTTAVTQIVLVRTGTLITALPVNSVVSILRIKPEALLETHRTGQFVHNDQTLPYYRLDALLAYHPQTLEPIQPTVPVILIQSASQIIALHVDEVLGNQDAVVKNLGPQLSQMPGLSGMTVLATGQTVLIYNPVALAAVYGVRHTGVAEASLPNDAETGRDQVAVLPISNVASPLVLIVDDSITMRRVLQRLLLREGYRVAQAADGRQALELLRVEKPVLVLSDVEMPRMDGFELLRQIRSTERFQQLPVVMITSRIADKHKDHAQSLGVNEYLGKPYPEEELIGLLHRYAGKATL